MSRKAFTRRRLPSSTGGRRDATAVPAALSPLDQARRLVRERIAKDRTIAVIGKADREWLRLEGRRTLQFPQLADGSYPGYTPADSDAAIAHLEAIRGSGADVLLVPEPASWWLSHFAGFAQHLQRRYDLIVSEPGVCTVYDLRRGERLTAAAPLVEDALLEADERLQRPAAVLDWGTGLDLAQRRDSRFVLTIPGSTRAVPYLDDSIDIVVVDRSSAAAVAKEARRIAAAAVLIVDGARMGDPAGIAIEWKAAAMPPAAQYKVIESADAAGSGIATTALQQRLRDAGATLAILVPARATLLPGAVDALLRALHRYPEAALATGKVFYRDGRLKAAGGLVVAEGETVGFGDGEFHAGAPIFSFRRDVDAAPLGLIAMRLRMVEQLGELDGEYARAEWAIADLCFQARSRAWRAIYTPEAQLVLDVDPPKERKTTPAVTRDAARFRARWQAQLAGRPAAPARYARSFWLAHAWPQRGEGAPA